MAVYTVSLRDTSGLGQVNVGDGTLLANLSVAAGRGPKGDGWTGVTYDENTGTFIFTSNDGLAYTSPDVRPDLDNVDINGGTIDGTVIGGTTAAAGSFTTGSFTADVSFGDNDKAIFGAGSDLQIFHSGTSGWIRDKGTGGLVIDTDGSAIDIKGSSPTEYMARFIKDGEVSLYYDNSPKLATTSTGVAITGNATFADNDKAIFGDGSDLQIYHSGSSSYVLGGTAGDLVIEGSSLRLRAADNTNYFRGIDGSATYLYHPDATNGIKLATASTGVDVTGTITSDGLDVVGGDVDAVSIKSDGSLQLYDPSSGNRAYTFLSRDIGSSMVGGNIRLDKSVTTGSHIGYSNGTDARGGSGIVFDNTSNGSSEYGDITFVQSNDTNDDTWVTREAMRIDSSGNVGIGTTLNPAKLSVQTADLGTTAGDSVQSLNLRTNTTNGSQILFTTERASTGTDWTTAAHKIQRKVDATSMGYMQFGNQNSDLITFGADATEYMRIDSGGRVTMPYQPSFKVAASYSTPTLIAGAPLSYTVEEYDIGNNFANSRFTAPVAGVYHFDVSVFVYTATAASGYSYIALTKNGSIIFPYAHSDDSNITAYHVLSLSRTVQLAANDYVQVYVYNDSSHRVYNGIGYNHFSGHLIG